MSSSEKQRSGSDKPDDANFFSATTFAKLGVSPKLQDALAAIGIERPSHVQVSIKLSLCDFISL